MYLIIINIFFSLISFSVFGSDSLKCNEEVLEFKNCKAMAKPTESGQKKIFKIDSGDSTKKCALWTGFIEASCLNGKWEIDKKSSKCKYECTCCY